MQRPGNIPPRLATRLLHIFLRDELVEDVTADLQEQYDETLRSASQFKAQLDYWYQVINYMRPFAIKNFRHKSQNPYPMYKSYVKTALRNMVRNKLHAFINIVGLSVGMAVTIVIGLWIWDELSYEKHFENYERIGQVIQHVTNNSEIQTWTSVPYPLADELRKNYGSDFNHVVLTTGKNYSLLSHGEKNFIKTGYFAEPDFLKVFSIKIIKGSPTPLSDPSSIMIAASVATAFFGSDDPIGEMMTIDHNKEVKVAAVFTDFPFNSKFNDLQFIAPWDQLYNDPNGIKTMSDPWRPNSFNVFVELTPEANFTDASLRIRDAKLKKVNEFLALKKPELFILPMRDWHLKSEFRNGKPAGGRIQYVWMFGIIGAFVLIMACINFMNLSTARSEKRAKEVGIRKAIGSHRAQLIGQFLCESMFTAFVSAIIAIICVHLLLSPFNQLAEKHITLPWFDPIWLLGGLAFSFIIGLFAGSYPAFYLSSIKSITAIKGTFKTGRTASLPRKAMVTIQFTVSTVLITGTAVVFLQIMHAKERSLGYEANGLVAVPIMSDAVHKHFDAIAETLKQSGTIVSMAEAGSRTTENNSSSSGFDWNGKDPELSVDFSVQAISYDYGKTISWQITKGRDFSRDFPSDSSSLIINEAAARFIGFKDPVGEVIRWHDHPLTIIGVVSDIIINSPYAAIKPNFYFMSKDRQNFMLMRIHPALASNVALEKLEGVYKKYETQAPFSYEFTDQLYARKFDNEERIAKLAVLFASLAIFISCLGIFGLSSFMAERRTKELGVRKVMGATVFDLWRMMSRDFILLVILSSCIAVPIAYQLLSAWLDEFSYRISLPFWVFVATTAGTLIITIVTVSWHTLYAARINPVNSLRSE